MLEYSAVDTSYCAEFAKKSPPSITGQTWCVRPVAVIRPNADLAAESEICSFGLRADIRLKPSDDCFADEADVSPADRLGTRASRTHQKGQARTAVDDERETKINVGRDDALFAIWQL